MMRRDERATRISGISGVPFIYIFFEGGLLWRLVDGSIHIFVISIYPLTPRHPALFCLHPELRRPIPCYIMRVRCPCVMSVVFIKTMSV